MITDYQALLKLIITYIKQVTWHEGNGYGFIESPHAEAEHVISFMEE